MKMKKHMLKLKNIFLIIVSAVMLISALPVNLLAEVSAASSIEIKKAYNYGLKKLEDSFEIAEGVTLFENNQDYYPVILLNGDIAYCIEPGVDLKDGSSYSANTSTGMTNEKEDLLKRVFLYAYTTLNGTDADSFDKYCPQYIATQMLVWEVMVGQRDANFNLKSNGYKPVSNIFDYLNSTYSDKVKKYYNLYENYIQTDGKKVSFGFDEKEDVITVESSSETYTFTDKNGQLKNFDVTVTNGSVVNKTTNQLTIKADYGLTASITMTQNNANAKEDRRGFIVYKSGNYQKICGFKADPLEYYAAVKGLEYGSLSLQKKSEDGKIEDVQFKITGPSYPNGISKNTNRLGVLELTDLIPGTYTITEQGTHVAYNITRTRNVVVKSGEEKLVTFSNTLDTGMLQIVKTAEDGIKSGFTFSLRSEFLDGTVCKEYGVKTTDGTGKAIWSDLPFYGLNSDGKYEELLYVITEEDAPDRYVELNDTVEYLSWMVNDVDTWYLNIENKLKRSDVLVVKKDSESGENVLIAGTEFQIYKINSETDESELVVLTDSDGNEVDTFVTDESGQILLPESLVYGAYKLVEVKAPEGYVLDSEPVYFTITEDGETVQVEKMNSVQKGTITITKTGDVFSSVDSSVENKKDEETYSPVFSESTLEGAEFEIIAAVPIYTPDGDLKVEAGEVVDTLTTGSDGTATSKELYLGDYIVRETKAPDGYIAESGETIVSIEYAGQEVAVTNAGTSFANSYQNVKISLEKYLESSEKYDIEASDYIQYVDFGLYAAEDIIASDGSKIPTCGLIEKIGLGEDFTTSFNSKLPFGKYYVQEISTDEHYVLSEKKYPVNFSYSGDDVAVQEIEINDGLAIENNLKTGKVSGLKISEDGEKLEGALIGIFFADEKDFSEKSAIETVTSDSKGFFEFTDVVFGDFLVKEIKSPTGYVLTDEVFPVSISEDGDVIEITIENKKIRGNVQVKKFDFDEKSKALSGAVFEIFSDANSDKKFSAATDKSYGTLTEISDGIYQLNGVEYGGYFLKETKAPEGYIIDENYYYFEISEDGETVTVSNNKSSDKFFNNIITGKVKGVKINADNKAKLAGALIGLFDENETDFTKNNAIETVVTDDNGNFEFSDIVFGKYIIKEIESPEGFILSEDVFPVNISENETEITITISNTPIKGNVRLIKYGDVKPEEIIKGAEFSIYEDSDGDGKYNSGDKFVGKMIEKSFGMHEYNDLTYGKYFVKETKAPEGYIIDENYYPFEISEDGKTITISNDNSPDRFYNHLIKGSVEIEKYDSLTDEKLSGAEFTVYADSDGNGSYDESDSEIGILKEDEIGVYRLIDVPYGKYLLKETKAPEGYIIDENYYPFAIEQNGEIVRITNNESSDRFENVKITTTTTVTTTTTTTTVTTVTKPSTSTVTYPSPKTGDTSKLPVCAIVIGAVALCGIVITKKKKKA